MTVIVSDDFAELRHQMVDRLVAGGAITDPRWEAAFRAVPRHLFAPAAYHVTPGSGQVGRLLRADNPADLDAYATVVYADDAVVTQVTADGQATSSSTQPTVMAHMLEALRVDDGMRVLEVGTGTGYNAALLCHRLGDERVTSVDIDPWLVAHAKAALATVGYHPTVVAGDGLTGVPDRAPYHRVIATCSTPRVPPAWLEQTTAGGIIVANLGFGVIPLRVAADGTAWGRFHPTMAAFIQARPATGPTAPTSQEILDRCLYDQVPETPAGGELAAVDDPEFEFVCSVCLPGVYWCAIDLRQDENRYVHCFADNAGSWARATLPNWVVAQGGPRRLWDEVAALWLRWAYLGRPSHERLGLTIGPAGEHIVWADEPDRELTRLV